MMRLGRRASLLVAFSLLTSAATAYAECAWVLWNEMQRDGWETGQPDTTSMGWIVIGGYATKAACDGQVVAKLTDWKKDKALKIEGNMAHESFHVEGQRGWRRSMRLICLPDTVDPRGPKGSR